MPFKRIVVLAGRWDTTPVVYNYLKSRWKVVSVIVEEGVPRQTFLKKRIKKLGWWSVGGQVLFQLLVAKPMAKRSKGRIAAILQQYHLDTAPIPEAQVVPVSSVNAATCLDALQREQPDLVIVHGTRIISKKILQSIHAPFINIHAGITPRYRGSHGGYWALANNDPQHCGVTVHLVDAGIDTGSVLAQGVIPFTRDDNFATYPYLQLGEGLLLLNDVLKKLEEGERPMVEPTPDSGLWHHPTLWGYFWKRITRGVK